MRNLETVRLIYDAHARGDRETVLAQIADDVEWEPWDDNSAQRAGVPWLQRRHGRAGVAEFFRVIAGLETYELRVVSLLAGGDEVAAVVVVEHGVPATGRRFRDETVHLWTLDADGKVIRMRHYADTAKHMHAAGVPA
jgi:uncharacterized protein